jgi:hypothetical protein
MSPRRSKNSKSAKKHRSDDNDNALDKEAGGKDITAANPQAPPSPSPSPAKLDAAETFGIIIVGGGPGGLAVLSASIELTIEPYSKLL